LLHTGAHKINNAIGQGLLAVKMGKPRIVAETGAGQHGVASATVAAHLGLECTVYMGTEDMARQALNVARMRMLGAEVIGVESGSRTLKDAINEAMRDWVTNVRSTHYLLGSVLGAHPYPTMVRDFQSVIGREARQQILAAEKRLPTHLFACVGGGSNAIGGLGYVACVQEMQQQWFDMGVAFDAVVVGSGSSGSSWSIWGVHIRQASVTSSRISSSDLSISFASPRRFRVSFSSRYFATTSSISDTAFMVSRKTATSVATAGSAIFCCSSSYRFSISSSFSYMCSPAKNKNGKTRHAPSHGRYRKRC